MGNGYNEIMNFVEQNWKILIGVGIVILIIFVFNLRSDNEKMKKEQSHQQLIENTYKQCLKDQPNEKHYLCTDIKEILEETTSPLK